MTNPTTVVGVGRRRVEGREKVTGATRFVADLRLPGLAHARLVLSPYASARITGYDLEAARSVPGVLAVVTGEDLPRMDVPGADLPLARGRVFFAGQPVIAVVAETEAAAADGAARAGVDYEEIAGVVDPFAAIAEGAPRVLDEHESALDDSGAHGTTVAVAETEDRHHNVSGQIRFSTGDAAAALAAAQHKVKRRWVMPAVHQGFLEPHASVARPEPDGGYTIWTATQGQFLTRKETARFLGLELGQVRIVPMAVGGGFGGKICLLEPLVAALAGIVQRPVALSLTRNEEFLMGRGAPGCVIDLELGANADGRLAGLKASVWFDNGAGQGGLAGLAGLMLCGVYRLPAYDFSGYDLATNKTPVGAYRAPGAPQAFFALESAMDELALALDLDPIEFRLRNASREGDPRPDGTRWPSIGLVECLEAARAHPLYTAPARPGEAIGVAAGAWGGGREPAAAFCRVEPDGSLALHVGYSDISGTDTTMAMIAAEAFGVAPDRVRVQHADTADAPYAGMAGGSKTVYTVGPAVQQAAAEARRQLLEIAAEELEAAPEDLVMEDGEVRVAGVPGKSLAVGHLAGLAAQFGGRYPPVLGQGRAAITQQSPMFTVHVARVRADAETGAWTVTGYMAVQDVGRAINPPEVIGQIQGGNLQALGRALGEQMAYDERGVLRTATFADYELPTVDQAPDIQVELVELPSPWGPHGAKGVGEPPAVPGPAAVANALARATGWRPLSMPVSWEELALSSRQPAPAQA
jgi:CO/xanthine dehydrogenase Mo-binding subunit